MNRRDRIRAAKLPLTGVTLVGVLIWGLTADPGEPLFEPADAGLSIDASTPASGLTMGPENRERRELRIDGLRPSAEARGPYSVPAGSRLTIDCAIDTRIRFTGDDGSEAGTMEFGVTGELSVLVRDRRDDELLMDLTFARVNVKAEGSNPGSVKAEAAVEIARDLKRRVVVRMHRTGRLLGFRFPSELRPENRLWFRTIAGAFFLELRDASETSWKVSRPSSQGSIELAVRWKSPTGDPRNRHACAEVLAFRTADCDEQYAPKVQGRTDLHHDFELGWPTECVAEENSTLAISQLGRVEQTLTGRFELRSVRYEAKSDTEEMGNAEWGAFSPTDPAADLAEIEKERNHDRWSKQLDGVTVDLLFAELLRAVEAEQDPMQIAQIRDAIEWSIRLDPTCLDRIEAILTAPGTPPRVVNAGLLAIAKSGDDAGREMLAGLLGDARGSTELRGAAARAMAAVETPTEAITKALVNTIDDPVSPDSLSSGALLVLGVVASRELFMDKNQRKTDAMGALLSHEQTAARQGRIEPWLEALGNSDSMVALERARPYLKHRDPDVRRSAVSALRAQDTNETAVLLLATVRTDKADSVRLRAVEILARHGDSRVTGWLADVANRDAEAGIRAAAIYELTARADLGSVAANLQHIAANDPAVEVRAAAREALQKIRNR